MPTRSANSHRISTLNEKPLHADLKAWYARPGDRSEVLMDGFLVDIVRDGLLVEIQTRNVSAIRRKLSTLAARHPVRLVYPIARERWIVREPEGERGRATRRKSPRRGSVLDLFEELVSIPKLPANANFSLEVLFIREDEVRRLDPNRSRRRHGWVTQERRLVEVLESRLFRTPADLAALIPRSLNDPFTTADLAQALDRPRWLAQKIAYCLRGCGAVRQVGKKGNALLYARSPKQTRDHRGLPVQRHQPKDRETS